jgi:hypothetical protein
LVEFEVEHLVDDMHCHMQAEEVVDRTFHPEVDTSTAVVVVECMLGA